MYGAVSLFVTLPVSLFWHHWCYMLHVVLKWPTAKGVEPKHVTTRQTTIWPGYIELTTRLLIYCDSSMRHFFCIPARIRNPLVPRQLGLASRLQTTMFCSQATMSCFQTTISPLSCYQITMSCSQRYWLLQMG